MKVSVGPFKALLIDWDGTLVDSLPIKISNAARLFSERFGVAEQEVRASYARHSGVPRRTLFDRIGIDCRGQNLTNMEFASLSSAFTEANQRSISERGSLRTGALDTLSRLHDAGVLLYLSTSAAQEEIDPLARHFGLNGFCHGIYGSRPSFSKGPDHAREVIELHGLSRGEVAGIGDDLADMGLFREAGICPIGITGTRLRGELERAGAELVIDNFQDILPHVI